MKANMKKVLIISLLCLFFLTGCQNQKQAEESTPNINISREELSQADGKNGNKCYVAISGTVYEIKNSSLWVDGEHTTSNGEANCGRDLTQELERSPHGSSVLTSSPKISKVWTLVE